MLHEPHAPTYTDLENFYRMALTEIRSVDNNHMIFAQANYGTDFGVFNTRWLLSVDNNAAYSMLLYGDSTQCPILTNYYTSISSVLSGANTVMGDNLPLMISEFGGRCNDWNSAAINVLQGRNDIQVATFWTYKGSVADNSNFLNIAYRLNNDQSWTNLRSRFNNMQYATDNEWSLAFTSLQTNNFLSTSYLGIIENYFDGTPVSYTYNQDWILGVVLAGCVLIAIGIIVAGILVYRRRRRNMYF